MRVLVTGAAGFIGSSLVDYLLSATDYHVVGIDSFSDYYSVGTKENNIRDAGLSERFALLRCDLLSADLEAIVREVDVIFHLAGEPGVRGSWGHGFRNYADANILATQRLLDAALSCTRLRRFVYASSSSVYGDADRYPVTEMTLPNPLSPYGVTKLAGEHLCGLYGKVFNLPTTMLRYFTVYGPRQRPDMAFTRMLRCAATGTEFDLYGDGSQIRDFTYVADIAAANIAAAEGDQAPGTVINLAGGSEVSMREAISEIEKVTGKSLLLRTQGRASGDVMRTGAETERAHRLLGWRPRVGLSEGLARQYQWIVEELERTTVGSE
ncbi:MAG: GDP-mannose 4,6-dehydratase [Bifidobacteriaceae bacterium]|jgi:nucleoside-diphosphate-sugar epimerase|nr:GDP-mannose 4,6-dehydratase [Bifidobacteriaceae bacterium]